MSNFLNNVAKTLELSENEVSEQFVTYVSQLYNIVLFIGASFCA